MAPELDMGMVFGMEAFSPSTATTTTTATMNSTSSNAYLYGLPQTIESLRIDDLLDFSTQDGIFDSTSAVDGHHHHHHYLPHSDPYSASAAAATTTAAGTAIGNCTWENNNPSAAGLAAFPDDLYIPSEEAAELEWLSKFVEDSFSDVPFPNPCGGGTLGGIIPAPTTTINSNCGPNNTVSRGSDLYAVPGRARSKRSRGPATATQLAAATTWSSSSPQLITPSQLSTSPSSSSSSSSETKHRGGGKKKELAAAGAAVLLDGGSNGTAGCGARKCTHCSSEKTPQWRTGPLGPKTLCNACGVRYKSGRLVPEYRPAASPTFVLTQHSNSHRKVMELRRQKEIIVRHHSHHHHQQQQHSSPHLAATVTMGAAVSSGSNSGGNTTTRPDLLLRDYEVC